MDLQDDIIIPEGIDASHFLTKGWINLEHRQENEYIIGAPTQNSYVDLKKGLFVEALLYKDNVHAKGIWDLAVNMHKSGVPRELGFSIEGFAQKRNAENDSIIEKVLITNVALTKTPANPQATWQAVLKSFQTGNGHTPETQVGAGALRRESLGQSLHNISSTIKDIETMSVFKSEWEGVGEYLDSVGRYDRETATLFLQIGYGYSRSDASEIITKMENRKEQQ